MRTRGRAASALLPLALLLLLLVGCRGMPSSRPPFHINPNMDYQEKLQPQEASDFFYDGRGMRLPVAGTVARGELREDLELETGKDTAGNYLITSPVAMTEEVLARGEDRYRIYCQPCHDRRGTGRGILNDYGAPTANLHDEIRLAYLDGQIYDVITNGVGLMKGYRYQLRVEDRWAVVAYVNRLQDERQARGAGAGGGL